MGRFFVAIVHFLRSRRRAARPRKFGLESRLQSPFLIGAQIGHFVLVVERHQPDLSICRKVVVDHPEATTLALASAPIGPSQLAKATGARHDIARLRIPSQEHLQRSIFIVLQVGRDNHCKRGGLDELHAI
jgi:hypothetical protein